MWDNRRKSMGTDGSACVAERMPPQNLDAERGVLGGCLLDAEVIDDVIAMLRPEDFYRDAHQIMFRRIIELRGRGEPVDAVTLGAELERTGEIDEIGGDDSLSTVANSVPHAANARYHAEIVRQKAQTRVLIQAASEIITDGYSNLMTATELVSSAESKIFAVRDREIIGTARTTCDLIGETMEAIEQRGSGTVTGIATGLIDLDDMLGGFKGGEMTIVGARPSQGKTALGLRVAMGAAKDYRQPVLFASIEMNHASLMNRILSAEARVDSRRIERNRGSYVLTDKDRLGLNQAAYRLANARLVIDDAPMQSVGRIVATARRLKRRDGLSMVLVDYLGLIDGERRHGESRQEEVARISKGLKAGARETGVPWIVLHQLNRESEKRGDKRPCLADLRESGQIEADADVVILLHRPAYYDPNDKPGVAEIIVAKNRNGPTGAVELLFEGFCTRFDNVSSRF